MKKLLIGIVKYIAFLALGFFLFWLSFRTLDLHEVWNDIVNANYIWVALATIITIFAHVFRALRWNLLINSMGYKTKLSTTFYALMVGYMANTAVPRMGEFMRCGVLSRKEKIPFNALFGSVISERLFDLVVLFILLLAVLITQWNLLGAFVVRMTSPFINKVTDNFVMLSIAGAVLLLLFVAALYFYLRFKNNIKAMPGYKRAHDLVIGVAQGVRTIDRMKQKGMFLLYTFLIWFFYILMMWVPFYMLDETSRLDFLAGVTLLAIGSLGIVAPVPGGIGAYHFIGKAVLVELYAISGNTAGSFVAITHAAQTLLNVVVGAFGYLMLFFIDHKKPLNEKD